MVYKVYETNRVVRRWDTDLVAKRLKDGQGRISVVVLNFRTWAEPDLIFRVGENPVFPRTNLPRKHNFYNVFLGFIVLSFSIIRRSGHVYPAHATCDLVYVFEQHVDVCGVCGTRRWKTAIGGRLCVRSVVQSVSSTKTICTTSSPLVLVPFGTEKYVFLISRFKRINRRRGKRIVQKIFQRYCN